jgi:pyocin large subunit-like protein
MSVQAISWALGCKTEKSSDKFVLLVLANYADQDGFCWPHVGTIAELTLLSVRAVRRCLTRLDGTFLTVEKQRGTFGQQASSHYFLDLNSEIIVQSDILSPSVQSDIDAPPECHPRQNQSDSVATYNNDEPSYIHVNNTIVQNDVLIVETDVLFDEWWKLYPRKQDKKKALAAWAKQGCEKNADSLIDTLRNQIANDAQYSGDQQYIPLPSSYLNKEKFNDEIVIRSRTEPRETSAEAGERELAAWTEIDDGAPMAGHDAVVPDVAIHVWDNAITDVD